MVSFFDDNIEQQIQNSTETIVAQATAIGFGGVGIVRVSGCEKDIVNITQHVLGRKIKPRYAYYGKFYDKNLNILDKGIALYFNAPHSYTGECVLELHCHGGPVVMDLLIKQVLLFSINARLAEPGEFTKRAWLNGKMDLAQIEAVSDLINATSSQSAYAAASTLVGNFSNLIHSFLQELIHLRTYVEAAIDFSDEQIDFIQAGEVRDRLALLMKRLKDIIANTEQGVILQEGVNLVITGKPNAGKSSLLNALCRKEEAIVTQIPGTTRDVIKTYLNIHGVPIVLTDTAGLRQSTDVVEQQGVKKALDAIAKAQYLLVLIDGSLYENQELLEDIVNNKLNQAKLKDVVSQELDLDGAYNINKDFNFILLINKIDKIKNKDLSEKFSSVLSNYNNIVFISAKNNLGIDKLEDLILQHIGFQQSMEGKFIARRRHLECLSQVNNCLMSAHDLLIAEQPQDLIAEELRMAQMYLSHITGEYSADELLGNIFSSFCIGK